VTGREGPGPERPGPDYPPEWDREPAEPNDGPGPDGHHTVTGECFACLVGVATGPESHGDRCPLGRVTRERGECLSAKPYQWCRWNDACRSCAPVAGSSYAAPSPDPWATQGPVPPPPF
jgi:hypothetical protein